MKDSTETIPPDAYILGARLKGHKEPILSLAVSPNGRLLASGGEDGVFIWDLQTMKLTGTLLHNRNVRGNTSCVTWLIGGETQNVLCEGTGLGFVSVWRRSAGETRFVETFDQRLSRGKEILCIKSGRDRAQQTRVAVGTRSRIVHLFILESNGTLEPCYSVDLDKTVPVSLGFADNTDIIVFGLYDGKIHILRGADGSLMQTVEIGGVFGSAAVSPSRNQFAVDGVVNGFDLYQLDSGRWKQNFPTGAPIRMSSKQVSFGEDFKTVVGGSDHGAVYVFDRKRGVQLQVLRHADNGMVQTVTTHDSKEKSIIVSASSSGNCSEMTICVWSRKHKAADTANESSSVAVEWLGTLLAWIICGFVIFFCYEWLIKSPTWQNFVNNIYSKSPDYIDHITEAINAMEAERQDLPADFDLLTTSVYDYL